MVDHVDDWQFDPHHFAQAARERAARVDDLLGDHCAVFGLDLPFARCALREPCHSVVGGNLHSPRPCALGHRHGHAGGVHIGVIFHPHGALDAKGFDKGMALFGFLGRDDPAGDAIMLCNANAACEPVQLLLCLRQPHPAAAVIAGGLTGLGLDLVIKLQPVVMDIGQAQRTGEVRGIACRMPSRTRGEFPLFHQHHIAPAFARQMIGQADAVNAAANDKYTCVFHGIAFIDCCKCIHIIFIWMICVLCSRS